LIILLLLHCQLLLEILHLFLQRIKVNLQLLLNTDVLSHFSLRPLSCLLQHLVILLDHVPDLHH
jgi:hypothetical protein